MLWISAVTLCLVFSTSQGWEIGKKYEYLFGSKLLIDGEPIKNVGTGLLQFKWDTQNSLTARLRPKNIGGLLPMADYIAMPQDEFQVYFKNGQVMNLKVSEDTTKWQVEFIRGILGLLQYSDLAKTRDEFSIVEETVAGKCATNYTVTRNNEAGSVTVIKTRDYTDCDKAPVFERGVYGSNNYDVLMKKRDIIARDTRAGYLINNNNEIEKAHIREDIKVISGNSTVEFSSEILLIHDESELEKYRQPSDDEDFEIGDLMSVGGIMYRAKPQKSYCSRQIGLQRNEIDSACETDYYMNPKEFDFAFSGEEVSIAKQMVEQISRELENPSEIPKTNTLDRFSVLVGVVRYMNLGQMQEMAEYWDSRGSKAFVFHSAISEAGTIEALQMLKYLKSRDEIMVDEIAIEELPGKVHPLTLEYLDTLFEFATDSDLMEKDPDFSGDLFLAFSNLLRRYSTEKEKPFKQEQLDKLILKKYRRYLSEKLQNALTQKDDLKFQIYVRALGNMADLSLFNYYLSLNSEKLTPFQKTLIVNSMDKLVEKSPMKSRVMLMKLYKNPNEKFSVRIAAVYQLFKTDLPEDMVLDIIEIAKDSGNADIQNAVKTTVLLEAYNYHSNERINEMAKTIEIDKSSLTGEEEKLSQSRFREYTSGMTKMWHLTEAIKGMDENPFSVFAQGEKSRHGFKNTFRVGGMIDNFAEYVRGFTGSSSYSSLYQKLRSRGSSGNIEIDTDYSQLFLPFTNLKSSPMDLVRLFHEDKSLKFTYLTMDEVAIGFATESGLPFLYSYQSPEYMIFEGATHTDDGFSVDLNLIYSDRDQTKMGFVNPLIGKYHIYGIDMNRQINIPVSISYTSLGSSHVITVDPLFREGNQRLFHLGTWPYLVTRDLFPVKPVAEAENVKNLKAQNMFKGSEDFEAFNVKVASSQVNPNGNILDYLDGKELEAYDNFGPFGELEPAHNLFNIFFKDDPDHPISLAITLDFSSDTAYLNTQSESAGKISGPFYFMGKTLFEGSVELTGLTNRTVALTIKQHTDLISETMKLSLEGSYGENDVKEYESCLDTYLQDQTKPSMFGIGNGNYVIFTKLRFGQTCQDGAFISAETEFDPKEIENQSSLALNLTIDFDGLPDDMAADVCDYKGEEFPEAVMIKVNVIQKDWDKCVYILSHTESENVAVTTTQEYQPEMDAEMLELYE